MNAPAHRTEEVIAERRGRLGLITLNRPKALNALNLAMVAHLDSILAEWVRDNSVDAVAIRGTGERAFCAGGDVRALLVPTTAADRRAAADRFFRTEYALNYRIHTFPKPYIAFLDGVTMGGGCGLSWHGSHRVVTARTVMSMPETVLGLFPDVGAAYHLARCPGATGMFLALAGYRMRAADSLALGLGTHYVQSADIDSLVGEMAAAPRLDRAAVDRLIATHVANPGPAPIEAWRSEIDSVFGRDTVEAIAASLETVKSDWAKDALKVVRSASPTSLKMTFRQVRDAAELTIAEVFELDYRLVMRTVAGNDFSEGVRSILVDKDQNPRWKPDTLAGVTEAAINRLFAPLDNPQERLGLGGKA